MLVIVLHVVLVLNQVSIILNVFPVNQVTTLMIKDLVKYVNLALLLQAQVLQSV